MLIGELTIKSLIRAINSGDILLPMIQRPFVWLRDEERITKLFDSVIKRFPIGMILFYQKPETSMQNNKERIQIFGRKFLDRIDDDTNFEKYDIEVKDGQLLVLDGHQRLQSLYLGCIDGPFYGKHLFYNMFFFRKERDVSEISFSFFKSDKLVIWDEKEEALYVRLAKILEIAEKIINIRPYQREQLKIEILQELENLLNQYSFSKDDYKYIYDHITETFSNSLFFMQNPHIFKYELIQNEDFDEPVLEKFVRFNQGGLPLTKSDLVFSTIKLQWKDVGARFEDLAEITGIDKDSLLKTLIVVCDISAGTKIQEVKSRIKILENNFEAFRLIIEGFHDKIKKLTEQCERIYKKFNFIIPVVYYFFRNKDKLEKSQDLSLLPDILRYILLIVFNSSLRSDNHLNKIVEIIRSEQTDEFPLKKIEEYLYNTGTKIDIDEISLNTDPILTFSLIQRNNWRPLHYNNKLNVDHIFPKSRINELPEELQPYIESIFNKYVVFQGDNIRKSDILPEEYFINEKARFINEYILCKEYLKKEYFGELIEWRKNKICELFRKNLRLEIQINNILLPVEEERQESSSIEIIKKHYFKREKARMPKTLLHVLEVIQLITAGKEDRASIEEVANNHNVLLSTIYAQCSRGLGLTSIDEFRELYKKGILKEFLIQKFPNNVKEIEEAFK